MDKKIPFLIFWRWGKKKKRLELQTAYIPSNHKFLSLSSIRKEHYIKEKQWLFRKKRNSVTLEQGLYVPKSQSHWNKKVLCYIFSSKEQWVCITIRLLRLEGGLFIMEHVLAAHWACQCGNICPSYKKDVVKINSQHVMMYKCRLLRVHCSDATRISFLHQCHWGATSPVSSSPGISCLLPKASPS